MLVANKQAKGMEEGIYLLIGVIKSPASKIFQKTSYRDNAQGKPTKNHSM